MKGGISRLKGFWVSCWRLKQERCVSRELPGLAKTERWLGTAESRVRPEARAREVQGGGRGRE